MARKTEIHSSLVDTLVPIDAGGGCPICVTAAILKPDRWGRKRVVSGRGLTQEEAFERCMSEAAERSSAVFDPNMTIVRASAADIDGEAVEPDSLLLISGHQYQSAADWNSIVEADQRLPAKFDRERIIPWVRSRCGTMLPAAHCFLGYPGALDEGFPVPDSSGLACGETADQAAEHALLELAERDAVAIWWYGRIHRPTMHLNRDKISILQHFEEWVKKSNRRFWLLDLTHDLGIFVAAAVTCNVAGRDISLGFGAGLTAERAAVAAIGELVQFDVTKRLQAQSLAPGLLAWCASADVAEHPYVRPHDVARQPNATARETVKKLLADRGLQVCILDMPDSTDGLKAVRAVLPGFRPIWPRFAPGRLYDVPQNLGWTVSKITEIDLNPVPILY
jgi:YcaO-like protein with predicted kinase domain